MVCSTYSTYCEVNFLTKPTESDTGRPSNVIQTTKTHNFRSLILFLIYLVVAYRIILFKINYLSINVPLERLFSVVYYDMDFMVKIINNNTWTERVVFTAFGYTRCKNTYLYVKIVKKYSDQAKQFLSYYYF